MGSTTFAELLAMPGVEEQLELRSRFGFMAYHGGALEEMTDVIAKFLRAKFGRPRAHETAFGAMHAHPRPIGSGRQSFNLPKRHGFGW